MAILAMLRIYLTKRKIYKSLVRFNKERNRITYISIKDI